MIFSWGFPPAPTATSAGATGSDTSVRSPTACDSDLLRSPLARSRMSRDSDSGRVTSAVDLSVAKGVVEFKDIAMEILV